MAISTIHKLILFFTLTSSCSINYSTKSEDFAHNSCIDSLDYLNCLINTTDKRSNNTSSSMTSMIKEYGPLSILLGHKQQRNNIIIFPAINSQEKTIYLAIDCTNLQINTTIRKKKWRGWLPPIASYEKSMLTDICTTLN